MANPSPTPIVPNDPASNRCFGKEFIRNVRPMSYKNSFKKTYFKVLIIYFIEGRSSSKHKLKFISYTLIENFLKGSAQLRHW